MSGPSYATLAVRLENALLRLESQRVTLFNLRAENAALREALKHVAQPLKWEQEHLPEGYTINGGALLQVLSNADYYQSIARAALTKATP